MLKRESGQVDFNNELLESMVRADHLYRKILELVDFAELLKPLHKLYSAKGAEGIKVFDQLCPSSGMVLADKGYAGAAVEAILEANGCHSGIIRKKNDPKKNREKDSWLTKLRMPFEGTFSKMPKKARYKGDEKTQFQATFETIAFNLKKLARISLPPAPVGA